MRLIHRQDKVIATAIANRLAAMPEEERILITGCIPDLCKIRNVGEMTALEILWAVGRRLQYVSPEQITNDYQIFPLDN